MARLTNLAIFAVLSLAQGASAAVLRVGPGKRFANLSAALQRARPGDRIVVWPRAGGRPYRRVALAVNVPRLVITAAPGAPVVLSGTGYNYSGRGAIPRAIVQFNPGASGCTLRGFMLTGARNHSANAAGVRILNANNVTVRNCTITGNQMGIMSGGSFLKHTGENQRIIGCTILGNGTQQHAGYNHNLYLAGAGVTIEGCDIGDALTGHDIKSRAHFNFIAYNYIHGAANREVDLVDSRGNTDVPGSDSVLLGNTIVKRRNMQGNHQVIHFGVDGGGKHTGTLYLVHNTIVTWYPTPIVALDAAGSGCVFIDNKVVTQNGGTLVAATGAAKISRVKGGGNRWPASLRVPAGVHTGPPLPWKVGRLPNGFHWGRQLMEYHGVGKIRPRRVAAAGAGSWRPTHARWK